MELPVHIADRIRSLVATTSTEGGHVDNEAAGYGGIPLMGTIGAVWLIRPDGSLWEVDDDFGRPLHPLPAEFHVTAIVAGIERHKWLAELLPARPSNAIDCADCRGRGRIFAVPESNGFVYCPACKALGWISA
jgi:hypothetical protein